MNLKKWFTKALAIVLAISLAWVPMEHVQAASGDAVNIPDAELRRYFCERLGKEEGDTITEGDLAGLTFVRLNSSNNNVKDLTGLEYCTNLTSFYADLNVENGDYSSLTNCSKLESIYIWDEGLTAAPDCSNMPNLTEVSLFRCDSLADISGLANCNNLTYVELEGYSDLADITPLKGKTGITHLGLEKVLINDENKQGYMETVSSLVNLETLELNYCDVTDEHISMLDPLTKLEELQMVACEVTQPDFLLCHKDTLKYLAVGGNPMGNSDVWKQLTNLEILGVGDTYITDFSFVSSLPNLTDEYIRWGEWPSRTYTYYYLAIDFSKDSFVLPNPVKDEKGNPVAPVASENYSYNAAANELIIPTTSIEYGELKGAVEYEFTMTAQTGDVLEVEHALDANVMGIKTQPQSMEILSGESGTLSVGWVGWGNTCQWYKDGVEIPGATDYQLKLNNVTKADEGSYTVVTSTDFGGKVATPLSVTSNPAVVTVMVPINITSQPEDLTLVEGQSGTLSVSASGEGTLSYQWYKGNSVITGANTAVLALNNVTMNDAGEYKVAISNAEGEVTSDVATVEVEEALEIVTQPADTSIIEGESGSLSVEAVGAGTLTYQWYKGSEAINGATAATLGLNNVTKETAGSYQVKVTDKNGNVTSSAANVTIEEKLEITGQPENITVIEGKNGVLTVTAIGEGTLSYQWYKGDTAISGATTASLALNDISLADAGEYTVKVTDKNGTVTSNAAMVTVEKKLVITEAPKGITVLEGKDGSLSVTAVGEGTLSYQWYKGDVKLNGANAATLELQKVDLSDAGEYKVVVTDKNGSITSRVAVVTVEKALKITNQPTGISLLEGEKGSLSVTAVGEGTLSYQWYKDDILLDGETDETLNLNNVALSDAGAYKVVVSDKNGSLTSDTAIVVVDKMLKITNQPQGIALVEGKNGTLSVSAIGEGTVSYQWYKGDEAITGATQETLNLTNVSMEDAGQYKVVVTDANKSITSNVVAVVVEKELTITKQPTGITLIEGENGSLLAEAIGADAISYQWYKDDVVVEGATNATYVFANVELADAGLYKVVVSDKNGNITSDVVEVVVEKALKIVKQPEGLSLEEDEAGSITVIASGEGTLSYQWYKDGVAIQGETAATLHFKALGLADEGQYMVEIHDKNSVLTSAVAEVEIEEEDDEEDEEEEVVGVIVSPKTGETGNLVWLLAAVLMALAGVTTFKKKEQ